MLEVLGGLRGTVSAVAGLDWLLLAGLLICAGFALAGWRWAAWGLLVLSAGWLLFNQQMEGPVLWALTLGHGVTLADLLVVPAAGLAWWRLRRRSSARRG